MTPDAARPLRTVHGTPQCCGGTILVVSRRMDQCARCGTLHNQWMSCGTARRVRREANPVWCRRCQHLHTDPTLAGICIGCACAWRPVTELAEPVRSLGECNTLPMFSDADAE